MCPDRSVSTARNDDQILRIRENKSCQIGHAVAVMQGGRSARIPRTAGRLPRAARGRGWGRNFCLRDGERDCRAAFRCHSVSGCQKRQGGYQIRRIQIGSGSFWLHTVDAPGCFAEAVNLGGGVLRVTVTIMMISGCEDSFTAFRRVELGLDG
jgi:hypothetical protein